MDGTWQVTVRRGSDPRSPRAAAAALTAAAALGLLACSVEEPGPVSDRSDTAATTTAPPVFAPRQVPLGDDRTVVRVVDGDTVIVDGQERVRLIGIDTPESVDPRRPVECFGREAAAFTASLLTPGTRVILAYDVEQTDRFGRTLAYVYRAEDDLFVNLELVERGYATPFTVPPNVTHADEFVEAARRARDARRGLWQACPDPDDREL